MKNTIYRNVKSGFYTIYTILGMNRSYRRLEQQKEANIKTQTNCKGVTQFNWHKEGEKYAAVSTAINDPSTSKKVRNFYQLSNYQIFKKASIQGVCSSVGWEKH